jgi:hypothetical protein
MKIRYYSNKQINKRRWNQVLDESYNVYVYAYSWYLDIVSPGWGALIADDYRYIMPLPMTKKIGLIFSLQPFYMQQLGVFSPYKITPEIIGEFINHLPQNIRFLQLHFNKFNPLPKINNPLITIQQRVSFELDLILPYIELYRRFNENTRRNIKAFKKHNLTVKIDSLDGKTFLDFYKTISERQFKGIFKPKHFEIVKQLLAMQGLLDYKIYAYSAHDISDKVLSVALLVYGHGRLIYLLNATNDKGKSMKAGFGIIDTVIESFAGNNVILDFAGGQLGNMGRFYGGFSAEKFEYSLLKINRLPFFMRPFLR